VAFLNLGDLYRDQGRKDEALRAYRKFLFMKITPAQKKLAERNIRELEAQR
jgi:predicted negative regulator of RcsB-dependent stress response